MIPNFVVERDKPPHLIYEVMSGLQHLYSIVLLDLHDSEAELRGGRFKFLSEDVQEHGVAIKLECRTGAELRSKFKDMLEWIADQASSPWSLRIEAVHMNCTIFHFSFRDITPAVLFKLVWF